MENQTPPQAKKRILIVEDEKFIRDLYVELLKGEGYEVDEATDGEEGYNAIKKDGYDLVLLDILLPKMDGIQILDKLKKESPEGNPNKAVVILSNMEHDFVIAKGVASGIRGYIVKSDYTPDQFVQEVKRFLAEG